MSEAIRWKKLEKIANDLMPFRCLICMEQVGSELQNRSKGYVIWKYCKNCGLEIEIRVTADQIQKAYDAPLEPVSIPIDVDAEIEAFFDVEEFVKDYDALAKKKPPAEGYTIRGILETVGRRFTGRRKNGSRWHNDLVRICTGDWNMPIILWGCCPLPLRGENVVITGVRIFEREGVQKFEANGLTKEKK